MNRNSMVACVCALLLLSVGSARAGRPDKDWKAWFGNIGLGYVTVQGDAGDVVDDDFNLQGGATLWRDSSPVGLNLNASYSNFDATRQAINAINDRLEMDGQGRPVTGGDAELWEVSANAMWGPRGPGKVKFYLAGGVGMYYHRTQVTAPGLIYYPPVCDPWWWWCYPGGVGPGTVAAKVDSGWDWGWNGGVGVAIEVGGEGSQIYFEAKYHSVQTDPETIDYIPIVVGYRW